MSVKSNGDSSKPDIFSGSVVFPSTASWPTGGSANFYTYTGVGGTLYRSCSVVFVSTGTYVFKNYPIITATISNGDSATFRLIPRIANVGKDGFVLYVYNSGTSGVELANPLTVNWVAREATIGKSAEAPNPNQ